MGRPASDLPSSAWDTAIVGLVHHGSGPPSTSLVDESFVRGVAEYAGAIARRYPWIDAYTPVNEPLTTARFSGLYGHWYPHRRDDHAFAAALVNQVRATRDAMRAIRAVNARAQLVQTEDICRISGTPPLRAQVEFENNRRWLSLDLLAGTVTRQHPLREFLVDAGISRATLDDLEHDPCPPDIIGLNYYLTSDRFLDHRIDRRHLPIGGNGRERYVDADAVPCPRGGPGGARASSSRRLRTLPAAGGLDRSACRLFAGRTGALAGRSLAGGGRGSHPLLPFHIFGIFLNMTYTGEVAKVLSVFAMVFIMIIILHFVMLTIQYTVAGSLSKQNPFFLMKTMAPAYFTALGTQSSAATIPVTLRQARKTGASDKSD